MSASKRAAANICAMVDDAMTMDQVIAAEYAPLIKAVFAYLKAGNSIPQLHAYPAFIELEKQYRAHIEGDATP